MATIRKRNNKFQVQVRRTGSSNLTRTFTLLKDAKEWARQTEVKIDRNELIYDRKILKNVLLGDLVVTYKNEVVPLKKSCAIETIILDAFLRHSICKISLANITTQDFAEYRDERLKVISPVSLKRQLAPIHNMFEIAKAEWGMPIFENPLTKLRLKAPDNKRQRRLLDGEYELLIQTAQTRKNPYVEQVIIFALETALRRGEILSLLWNQIDLKKRYVSVIQSKNGHSRTIPLTSKAFALLHEMNTDQMKDTDRVFDITANALKLAWRRMIADSSIEDLRFHDLRHEAVSRYFEMGLTIPEIASISGHKDIRMLMRYAHHNTKSLMNKIN